MRAVRFGASALLPHDRARESEVVLAQTGVQRASRHQYPSIVPKCSQITKFYLTQSCFQQHGSFILQMIEPQGLASK